MIGGLIKSNRIAALAGAGFIASAMAVSPAQAADLGGDCCADLEERVATLEATTARKGNRKVSLTVSGWVNSALYAWDDGYDSDAYVNSDNGTTLGSRFTFAGSAKINSDWSAGYDITIEVQSATPLIGGQNQIDDDGNNNLSLFYSNMWIKSEQLGKVTWGLQSQATDNITVMDLSGAIFSGIAPTFEGVSFRLRNQATGAITATTWGQTMNCLGISLDCNGIPHDLIRYDSPTIGGFTVSASWGEDDFWDVALRYAGEFGDIKVAAGIGYSEDQGDLTAGVDNEAIEGGVSVMHTPTGVFVNFSASAYETNTGLDSQSYYVKAGIKQRWNSLGATAIYGEYGLSEDNIIVAGAFAGAGTEVTRYGAGIHQWIDAASLQLYAKWDRLELDSSNAIIDGNELDQFTFGGVIFF